MYEQAIWRRNLNNWNRIVVLPVKFKPRPPARVLNNMTKRWQDFRMNRSTAATREEEEVDPSNLSYLYFISLTSSSNKSSTRTIWLKISTL